MLVRMPDGRRDFGHVVASLQSLKQRLAAIGIPLPVSNPVDWPWAECDPQVAVWLGECGEALAQIILNSAAVIEFELAVIEGGLPKPFVERLVGRNRCALESLPLRPLTAGPSAAARP